MGASSTKPLKTSSWATTAVKSQGTRRRISDDTRNFVIGLIKDSNYGFLRFEDKINTNVLIADIFACVKIF